ncbi:hypothetical protein KZZ52_53235 [Dactylosporangium sp. AC04546]|uniref:hypothetical protein n=1 Tax=Dactylosporangium sp. AC04546 TaxID=2862460 RepID=UPI001EDDAC66|nr:hypothetical protein [Dactylosporangium sp. AC04546]WVK82621.1 hypothetical protein KZZ52_53235 [Dactylosporangium sp. AC04546]
MPDLVWDDVRAWFDPEVNGVLPDVCVPDTTVADWQAVVDLVRSRGWAYEYSENGEVRRMPGQVEDMLSRGAEAGVMLKVWPAPQVLAIFRPWSADRIDFDVDLRELQGQERLDVLCGLFRAIGRRLAKPVLMSPEGLKAQPVIGYRVEIDRVAVVTQVRSATSS